MSQRKKIETLSADINRLRIEYEQYFMRVLKREPIKLRSDIERRILIYSNTSLSNTALKFSLNSLTAKYNSYKQYWGRIIRAIEEGTYIRRAEGSTGIRMTSTPTTTAPLKTEKNDTVDSGTKESNETAQVERAYKEFIETRKKQHESVKGLSFEKFSANLEASKKRVFQQYKATEVEIKVSVKDGKTKLILKPKKSK